MAKISLKISSRERKNKSSKTSDDEDSNSDNDTKYNVYFLENEKWYQISMWAVEEDNVVSQFIDCLDAQ